MKGPFLAFYIQAFLLIYTHFPLRHRRMEMFREVGKQLQSIINLENDLKFHFSPITLRIIV